MTRKVECYLPFCCTFIMFTEHMYCKIGHCRQVRPIVLKIARLRTIWRYQYLMVGCKAGHILQNYVHKGSGKPRTLDVCTHEFNIEANHVSRDHNLAGFVCTFKSSNSIGKIIIVIKHRVRQRES